jgi:hypothetical protein
LRFGQHIQEGAVIAGAIEEPELSNTSIEYVKDDTCRCDSYSIWHGTCCNQDACQHGVRRRVTQEMETEVSLFV